MTLERGTRIELVRCNDEHTQLEPGQQGTVRLIDSMGTVHVNWDSGHNLGLIPGEDAWRVLSTDQSKED